MRKYLLPEDGNFYKANLHCHSTISDGRWSPEEIKKNYMEQGYSVIAFTDHDVMIPHPELADENFLPLNAYEMEITEPKDPENPKKRRTCHLCFIAKSPKTEKQVCWHREKYAAIGNTKNYHAQVKFDESLPDYEREYSHECINDMIKRGREAGFFVTYNHPTWSLESYPEYIGYEGMNAMEICNYGCLAAGFDDYNPRVYDDILTSGKRIFCTATDDNHNAIEDSFGGFTVIKAPRLEYEAVTEALEAGNFYASQGPAIEELWFEDGKIHVTCSPAVKIYFNTGVRKASRVVAKDGESLTEAEFEVKPEYGYVRITVIDREGYPANTNAYFVDSLLH
jgi:hypothetical protein